MIIHKSTTALRVAPNLADYDATCAAFSWEAVRAEMHGLPGGGLNIAHEAVERQAAGAARETVAIAQCRRRPRMRGWWWAMRSRWPRISAARARQQK